jgi:hypothetical protein
VPRFAGFPSTGLVWGESGGLERLSKLRSMLKAGCVV